MIQMRLTNNEFRSLIDRALRELPQSLSRVLHNVVVEVEPRPDSATCRSLGIDDPHELMGLYEGTPITERSVEDSAMLPDRIIIYQASIESIADSPDEIVAEIRTTVLHEVGHHFGLDEDDLEALGYD